MVRVCESNIIFPFVRLSICPSLYLLLIHWAEFNQTCYMTSPHGKGVGEQVHTSVMLLDTSVGILDGAPSTAHSNLIL